MSSKLFVGYKPPDISSNFYLTKLKRKYKVKKAGFSGTLDPFAKGVLLIAFGDMTKLFRFLKTTPKTYVATLWLGAKSYSLDTESIYEVTEVPKLNEDGVKAAVSSLEAVTEITPPAFSAKWVDGKRAYELARQNKEFELKKVAVQVHSCRLLCYNHPFVTFEATVSGGTYIRTLGEMLAKKLGCDGSLSALERMREGDFVFCDEKAVDFRCHLEPKKNRFLGEAEWLLNGKKLRAQDFEKQDDGEYFVCCNELLAIIRIESGEVEYLLNNIKIGL